MGINTSVRGCLHHGFRGQEIRHQHGDVQIRTLRHIYGGGFAPAFSASHPLRDVLAMLDRPSLDKLLVDYKRGELDAKIAVAVMQDLACSSLPAVGLALGCRP